MAVATFPCTRLVQDHHAYSLDFPVDSPFDLHGASYPRGFIFVKRLKKNVKWPHDPTAPPARRRISSRKSGVGPGNPSCCWRCGQILPLPAETGPVGGIEEWHRKKNARGENGMGRIRVAWPAWETAQARCFRESSSTGARENPPEANPRADDPDIGGYRPGDIEIVAAFDIDRRKVGGPCGRRSSPRPPARRNSSTVPGAGRRADGPGLDGVPPHAGVPRGPDVPPSDEAPCDVEAELRDSGRKSWSTTFPSGRKKPPGSTRRHACPPERAW